MEEYDKIEDMFEDGIISRHDAVVIWGKRGKGKSSLAGKFMSEFMRPEIAKEFIENSKELCSKLNDAGIVIWPPEDNLVFMDTYFEDNRDPDNIRTPYKTKILDFGLPNDKFDTGTILPFSQLFFEEIQDKWDSHNGSLPVHISKGMELARHIELFICLTTQRPYRVPKDIRDLVTFIEVVRMKTGYDKYSNILGTIWDCNIIYDNANLEAYLSSHDEKYVDKKVRFVFRGNIFDCYDQHYFAPAWYTGGKRKPLVLEKVQKVEFTKESFEEFEKNHKIGIAETIVKNVENTRDRRKKQDNGNGTTTQAC